MTLPGSGRRFPLVCVVAGVAALAGGIVGWIDLGWLGMVPAVLFGAVVGFLAGMALRLVVWMVRGRSLPRAVACLLGLAGLALLAYEGCWLLNLTAANMSHATGTVLTQATARGDSRASLRDQLWWRQWRSAVMAARPFRWVLTPDALALSEVTVAVCDGLEGKGLDLPPEHRFRDRVLGEGVQVAMQSEDWGDGRATDPLLNQAGAAICDASAEQISASVTAMTFRRFPLDWFDGGPLPPDGRVKYQLSIKSAVIADAKSDGRPWDPTGNAPDPYAGASTVNVRTSQPTSAQTSVRQNTHRPEWDGVVLTVAAGDEVTLKLWDDDLVSNDAIGEYRFTVSAEMAEAGEQTVSFAQVKELRFILRRVD
jgi:hypothetical protein